DRIHRRHCRRLQPDPRRAGGWLTGGCHRQHDRCLRHRKLSRRRAAAPPYRDHLVQARGPAWNPGRKERVMPKIPRWVALLIGLAILIAAPIGRGNYISLILSTWLIYTIAAMGLNLTLGYAGQISLAQAAFIGIGAYVSALMTLNGWHWLVTVPCAVALCF